MYGTDQRALKKSNKNDQSYEKNMRVKNRTFFFKVKMSKRRHDKEIK